MDKEKINEIIDKKLGREEAKKLLNKEEFLEYEKLSEIKSVLSEMHIEAPETIRSRAFERIQKKRRFTRFYFALTGALSLLIVSLLILHSFTPLNTQNRMKSAPPASNSLNETVPSTDTGKKNIEIKTLTPINMPTIKIKLNKKYSSEELFNALKKCGNVSSNIVEVNKDNFAKCVETLKGYGIIQTDISSIKSKVQQRDNVKVKIEVIK